MTNLVIMAISTNCYLVALPTAAKSYTVSTSTNAVDWTVLEPNWQIAKYGPNMTIIDRRNDGRFYVKVEAKP